MKSNHKTFTLIELILVVAIVAVLAAAMIPTILSARKEARASRAMADLEAIKTAYLECRADTGLIFINIV